MRPYSSYSLRSLWEPQPRTIRKGFAGMAPDRSWDTEPSNSSRQSPPSWRSSSAPWGTAGTLEVWLDEVGGKGHQLGSLSIPEGANDAWQTNAIDVQPTVGRHDLFFRFTSSAKGEIAHVRTFQFRR